MKKTKTDMKLFDEKRFLPLGLLSIMMLFLAPVSAQNNSEDLTVVKGFVTDARIEHNRS